MVVVVHAAVGRVVVVVVLVPLRRTERGLQLSCRLERGWDVCGSVFRMETTVYVRMDAQVHVRTEQISSVGMQQRQYCSPFLFPSPPAFCGCLPLTCPAKSDAPVRVGVGHARLLALVDFGEELPGRRHRGVQKGGVGITHCTVHND